MGTELAGLPTYAEPSNVDEAKVNIQNLGHNMSEHAYLVGKNLLFVKGELLHGEYELWILANVWFAPRTARKFTVFAEKCDKEGLLFGYEDKPKTAESAVLPPPLPKGEFEVIYADPPWKFDNSGLDEAAAKQYLTMGTEDIAALDIPKGRVSFLWSTASMLPDALFVMQEWGYDYKTHIIWSKDRGPMMGWWVTTRHEILLIGSRGGNWHPKENQKPLSVIEAPRGRHSEKPLVFTETIEQMYDGPYVELFARENKNRVGWTYWGNEVKDEWHTNRRE